MTAPTLSPTGWYSIQAVLDGVDHLAVEMERKWGAGRLRLLVAADMRERFDRQQAKFSQAVQRYDVGGVTEHGAAMERAWRALDAVAEQAGAQPLSPVVWEAVASTGEVIAIVRSVEDACHVVAQDRAVQVWTLDEVIRVIESRPEIGQVKAVFPGATVTAVRMRPEFPALPEDDLADLLGTGDTA